MAMMAILANLKTDEDVGEQVGVGSRMVVGLGVCHKARRETM